MGKPAPFVWETDQVPVLVAIFAICLGVLAGAAVRPEVLIDPPPAPSLALAGAGRTAAPMPADDPPMAPPANLYVQGADGQWMTPDARDSQMAEAQAGAAAGDAEELAPPAAVQGFGRYDRAAEIPPPTAVDAFTP